MVAVFAASIQVDTTELHTHLELIAKAAGVDSLEKLAVLLEMDESQLWRQAQGEGHFSLTRMVARLEKSFWPRYFWLGLLEFGLPEGAQRAADVVAAYSFGRFTRKPLKVEAEKRSA